MEATSQIRPASRDQSFDSVKARVVTRAIGVRFGGFGLDYTSKQVTVDPEDQASSKKRNLSGQAFDAAMQRERLRDQLLSASGTVSSVQVEGQSQAQQQAQSQAASSHPDPAWRRGLAAYAKARDMLAADTLRSAGTTLAVA